MSATARAREDKFQGSGSAAACLLPPSRRRDSQLSLLYATYYHCLGGPACLYRAVTACPLAWLERLPLGCLSCRMLDNFAGVR